MGSRVLAFAPLCLSLSLAGSALIQAQQRSVPPVAARLRQAIDENSRVTLQGQVRGDLARHADRGIVEDSLPLPLFLVLKRSTEQQADLDGLLDRQQNPASADYHKWLTPKDFGARYGLAAADTEKITRWLESRGFTVKGVLNNGSMVSFEATAGRVRDSFRTQMRYYDVDGARYPANAQEPSIPAALSEVVSGIQGLDRFPLTPHHSPPRTVKMDSATSRLEETPQASLGGPVFQPSLTGSGSSRYVGAQDFYSIYNVKPTFAGGNLGAGTTIAVVEQSDMVFGTVDPTTGVATGGDVANFRTAFNVPGKLNMVVMHGAGSVTCNAPGIVADELEATLDAEWANATAPSAKLLYMSCDSGIVASLAALVDNNLGDAISISYGASELYLSHPVDSLYQQAAAQGQSIMVSSGDSGSDTADQNTTGTATSGISVNALASSPLVTALGGTDFSDQYDYQFGGKAPSFWSTTNPSGYGTALGYVPETVWNGNCSNSLYANFYYYNSSTATAAAFCGGFNTFTKGYVVGGGGGISTQYRQPSWQTGIAGLSASVTMRAVPDVSLFSSSGFWQRVLLLCDTTDGGNCVSGTFNIAGGTSFAAPQFAGITGLIVAATGSRQGVLNPNLYALARAQFAAAGTATACYANGQTRNNGVTAGLPASGCIFNDVTTGNNDVPCQAGSKSCYVDSGSTYGILSTTGASSLTVAYPAGPGYDLATGLGSVNVTNLVAGWNQGFSSATALSASPTSITSAQSTVLTATVTAGTPTGFSGPAPSLSGSVTFTSAGTLLGSCTLSGTSCSASVTGSALQTGANSVTATFGGNGSYPSSTSSAVTVTATSSIVAATLTSPTPGSTLSGSSVTFGWNPGTGNTNYVIYVGSGAGTNDLYSGNPVYGVTSLTVSGLPVDGRSIYVRLWSRNGNAPWQYNDYTYTAASPSVTAATMTSPSPGSTLSGSSVTFNWNPGTGTTNYVIYAGSAAGTNDFYSGNPVYGVTSLTVSGIPVDGRKIYVRLWSRNGNAPWQYNDYIYTAASPAASAATLTSPAPGSQLSGSSVTFGWNPGSGTTNYVIYVGSSPATNNFYSGNPVYGVTSLTVSGLPADGRSLYVRLWSRADNAPWQSNDYVYTAAR